MRGENCCRKIWELFGGPNFLVFKLLMDFQRKINSEILYVGATRIGKQDLLLMWKRESNLRRLTFLCEEKNIFSVVIFRFVELAKHSNFKKILKFCGQLFSNFAPFARFPALKHHLWMEIIPHSFDSPSDWLFLTTKNFSKSSRIDPQKEKHLSIDVIDLLQLRKREPEVLSSRKL